MRRSGSRGADAAGGRRGRQRSRARAEAYSDVRRSEREASTPAAAPHAASALELEGELDRLHPRPRVRRELPLADLLLEAANHSRVLLALDHLDVGGAAVGFDDPAHHHAAGAAALLLVAIGAGAKFSAVAGDHAHDVPLAELPRLLHARAGRRRNVGIAALPLRGPRRGARQLLLEKRVDRTRLACGEQVALAARLAA